MTTIAENTKSSAHSPSRLCWPHRDAEAIGIRPAVEPRPRPATLGDGAASERGPIPIAAVLYGDHCDAPDRLVQFIPWSDSGSEIISKVEAAEEAPGGDIPEALEDALHEALKRLEELGSIAHLFVFTDAPPHSSGACPKGLDFEEQVVSLLQLGVSITLVPCGEVSNPWWDLGWSKFKGETLVHLVKLDDLHGSVRSALMV